jgi:hypothetical protein
MVVRQRRRVWVRRVAVPRRDDGDSYDRPVLEPIGGLPDGVIGMRAVGTLSVADYLSTVAPALEDINLDHGQLRLLLVLGTEFSGFGEGAWGELTQELRKTPFHRGAVVTDDVAIRTGLSLLRFTLHGHVRSFSTHDLDLALTWVAS